MDATCGAGTAHPQFLVGFIYLIFSFLFNVLNIIVCPFAIVLSVLQFTASDYPVCIFKLGWMEGTRVWFLFSKFILASKIRQIF
jgi:hypothetical protein